MTDDNAVGLATNGVEVRFSRYFELDSDADYVLGGVFENLIGARTPFTSLVLRETLWERQDTYFPGRMVSASFLPFDDDTHFEGEVILRTPGNRARRAQGLNTLDEVDKEYLRQSGWWVPRTRAFSGRSLIWSDPLQTPTTPHAILQN